jgi:hypothetical protein
MRSSKLVLALIVISLTAASVAAQQVNTWYAGKLHPCTGDSVLVTEEMIYDPVGGRETIRLTVLGASKEWTDWNSYYAERSDFIHGVIGLAGLACGSGGATSLTSSAAVSTFQQNVFTTLARPRMAGGTATTPAPQPKPVPAPSNQPAPSPSDQTTPPPAEPGSEAEQPVPPVQGAGTEAEQSAATVPGTGTEAEQPAPVAPPTETSSESGKAVELTVVKKEAGTRPVLPSNNVTTDLEWNIFKMKEAGGNNFALRAGYHRTLGNEKITVGGTLVVNTMILMDKLFFNNALNLSGTYLLTQTSSLERKIGGSLNTFMVADTFYGTPFGMSVVASFSDNWFIRQDNIVTYGGMLQQSFIGDSKTTLVTAGVLFGIPIKERFALNPSAILAYNILTVGKDGTVKPDNPFMLQPAFNGSIYFSRLFTLDCGMKTTLFIKDYSDFILTVGATVLF